MSIANKKILVIGGSGFLGARFLEFASKGFKIYATYLNRPVELKGITEYQLDIFNLNKVAGLIRRIDPQIIFFAARVAPYDEDQFKVKEVMSKLISFIRNQEVRFIYVSSDAVFDGQKGNYREDDLPNPQTNYGNCKKIAEDVIKEALSNYVIIRTSYIYGRNKFGFDKRIKELLNELQVGKKVYRFSDGFRSLTFVDDLAIACWKILFSGFNGFIHLAGERKSIFDFSLEVAETFGYDHTFIEPAKLKNFNGVFPKDTSLDAGLARKLFNFRVTPVKVCMRKTCQMI